jgi:hypothetical protein
MTGGGAGTSIAAKHDKKSAEMVTKHIEIKNIHRTGYFRNIRPLFAYMSSKLTTCAEQSCTPQCAGEHRTY